MSFIEKWIADSITRGFKPIFTLAIDSYTENKRAEMKEKERQSIEQKIKEARQIEKDKRKIAQIFSTTFKCKATSINIHNDYKDHYSFIIDDMDFYATFSDSLFGKRRLTFKSSVPCAYCRIKKTTVSVDSLVMLGDKLLNGDKTTSCPECKGQLQPYLDQQFINKILRLHA